jgi:hypothetical protein
MEGQLCNPRMIEKSLVQGLQEFSCPLQEGVSDYLNITLLWKTHTHTHTHTF